MQVKEEIKLLDSACAKEVQQLEDQLHNVEQLIKEREQELIDKFALANRRGHTPDASLEGDNMDPRLKALHKEYTSIDERYYSFHVVL
jgi:hypothetical protein